MSTRLPLSTLSCYILLVGAFYIIFVWSERQKISMKNVFLGDHRTFENYVKIRTPNPTCPWLNETEWKIYKELTTPNVFVLPQEREKLSLKDLGLVTFVSKNHLKEALANCASIRAHSQLQHLSFTVFFSYDVDERLAHEYTKACPHAKTQMFPFKRFPKDVQTMKHYRFKALHQAIAFKNHRVLLSFDTSILFNKMSNFTGFVEKNIKENPLDVTLLTSAHHNMFSTIHPKMYSCFPQIQPKSVSSIFTTFQLLLSNSTIFVIISIIPSFFHFPLLNVTQFQSGLMLWIGSENGWKIMKKYVECSLQPSCIAPPGATIKCNLGNIYKDQKKYSGCHRFDQAAINLILYENSGQKSEIYERTSDLFSVFRIKQ